MFALCNPFCRETFGQLSALIRRPQHVGASDESSADRLTRLFNGPELHAAYVDLHGTKLVEEIWRAPGDGTVQLLSCEKVIDDPDFRG